jgi:predicted PurR-regulated permease PerM
VTTSVRVLAILGVLAALKLAAPVLLPLVLSVLFFYALSPVVDSLQRWRIPRPLASFGAFGVREPAATPVVTTLEGYVLTPMLISRTSSLNHVSIFVSIAFWAWGIAGMLLAVPIFMVTKAVCDHVPGLEGISVFLTERSATS